jgi:Co/Zn/Cd efflux system component
MQVGLATESLARNNAFQSVSYGFTVFSILGALIAASLYASILLYHYL